MRKKREEVRHRRFGTTSVGMRSFDRGDGARVERQMEGEGAKRAQAIVGQGRRTRVKAPNPVGPMVMADGKKLGSKKQRCGKGG
jgi:hypothetical protein